MWGSKKASKFNKKPLPWVKEGVWDSFLAVKRLKKGPWAN
jgi:hypothetical protein